MTATETAPPLPELLTTAEVLERLKISRTKFYTLRKQVAENGHPVNPVRLGRSTLRWPASDLAALLEALTVQS